MSKDDYRVGYGKPPRHSQFPKGKSGNPTGKRARQPSLIDLLNQELGKMLPITENGKTKRITKHQAIAMRCVQQALQGDHRARILLMEVMTQHDTQLPLNEGPITFTLKLEEDDD